MKVYHNILILFLSISGLSTHTIHGNEFITLINASQTPQIQKIIQSCRVDRVIAALYGIYWISYITQEKSWETKTLSVAELDKLNKNINYINATSNERNKTAIKNVQETKTLEVTSTENMWYSHAQLRWGLAFPIGLLSIFFSLFNFSDIAAWRNSSSKLEYLLFAFGGSWRKIAALACASRAFRYCAFPGDLLIHIGPKPEENDLFEVEVPEKKSDCTIYLTDPYSYELLLSTKIILSGIGFLAMASIFNYPT